MCIYTYNFAKTLSEILDVEFQETPEISDQELDVIPEDSNLGGTDYVSGMIWITNGEENSYLDSSEKIPEGWNRGRTIVNHMSKTNPEKYREICKLSAEKQWDGNEERKKIFSNKLKKYWENNYDVMAAKARKNGKHGLKGIHSKRSIPIEYKGVVYYGWRELRDETGVTKGLYKKYYLNGIDPEPRIGKDGPAPSTSTVDKVHQGGSA